MSEANDKPRRPPSQTGMRRRKNPTLVEGNLTVEQEAFARARSMGMSVDEAIKAAGLKISRNTARDWDHKNQAVRTRINELSAFATKNAIINTGLDREWVISRYMQIVERCMQAEPVLDKEGSPTGEFQFDAKGANTALRALGDALGLFRPVDKKPGDEYAELSDDDITRIVAELAAQTGLAEAIAGAEAPAGSQQAGPLQALSAAG